jgi:hypothetical protein
MLFQDWGNGLATYPGFSTATVRQQCQRQCQRPRAPVTGFGSRGSPVPKGTGTSSKRAFPFFPCVTSIFARLVAQMH